MTSLRHRLLVSLLVGMVAAFSLGTYATYRSSLAEINTLMDYHLRQFALSLRSQALGQPSIPPDTDESLDFVIQIWDREGLRLYLSRPHSVLPAIAQLGYATVRTVEGDWRVFSLQVPERVIQVAQPMSIRSGLAAAAAWRTLLPMLLMLPLTGALIWLIVGRGLVPLDQVAAAVRGRQPNALDPLPTAQLPDEILPLVEALNGLLGRLGHALATQRAFVADAAHELRTPLTALQLQVQLVERAAGEAERAERLTELKQGLQRAARVVNQLLTLARQEPDAEAAKPFAPVALAELAAVAVAEQLPLAEAKGIDLGAGELDAEVVVSGDAAALRTLLGNLLDNAVRYTPAGGRVDVAVRRTPQGRWLEVSDSGPGIPPEERERVLDRFYRREGETEPGSGLGLAIVRAIAERHRASVELGEAPQGGLRVRIGWPPG